jgi:hypothetical protein
MWFVISAVILAGGMASLFAFALGWMEECFKDPRMAGAGARRN